MKHVKRALTANGYMKCVFAILKKREKIEDPSKDRVTARKFPVSISHIFGISENLQTVFRSHRVPSYHKPFNTLRSLLVRPKDKTQKEKQCGVVYSVKGDGGERSTLAKQLGHKGRGEI